MKQPLLAHIDAPRIRHLGRAALLYLVSQCSPVSAQEAHNPIISEFLASNQSGLVDNLGRTSDWIEIWNPTTNAVATEGLFLTDDPESPGKWALPEGRLEPNSYRIVFASGLDRIDSDGAWHANFRISADSDGFLALTRRTNDRYELLSLFDRYPKQEPDVSFGIPPGFPDRVVYFQEPTPGRPNQRNNLEGFVADTEFSIDRGFYTEPIKVTISSATPGATIVYTTDGSRPTTRNGTQIAAGSEEAAPSHEVAITTTTTLRAMAFRSGFAPTNVDTQTYIFPDKVLQQDDAFHAIGSGVRWGHAGPDWEMDTEITQHPDPEIRPEPSDLLRIPTVSLGLDFDEMFGSNGIYIAGQSVERATSIEYLSPDLHPDETIASVRGFQIDGTVQIVGGSSPNRWKSDKLSLRLKFENDLEYPVFGRDAVDRFDTLVLDARLNNVWHYGGGVEPTGQRNRAQYVRDQYTANLHNQMGGSSPHGHHVHVYLNGIYWGIHTLHERPDDNFAASYLGGDNEDYDSIKHRPDDVLQGSSQNYLQLHSLADQIRSSDNGFESMQALLDLPDFIAYMLVNYYVANTDWAHHNWYSSYNRVSPDGRWRFHSWDAEKGLHRVTDDRTNRNDQGGPTNLHHDLIGDPEFRLMFADHAYEALRYGPLSPSAARQSYFDVSEPINLPLRVESARWGDNQRSTPYDRLDWLETRNQLFGTARQTSHDLHDYFARRSEIVLEQFRRRSWLPPIPPPVFNQHGGFVDSGFVASIQTESPGTIYYTIDGKDPRIPGSTGQRDSTPLVQEGARKKAFMPEDDRFSETWFLTDFDDTSWASGRRGAGYENGNGYEDFLDSGLDFADQVSSSAHESLYLRIDFDVNEPTAFDGMTLKMRYDDGFIAYLNGTEIARANSRGNEGTLQAWNASAASTHSDAEATSFIPFDVSDSIQHLQSGNNVLAVHGLNTGQSSSDFLIWPTLEAYQSQGGSPSGMQDSAIRYTGGIQILEPTLMKARVKSGSNWSPLLQAAFLPNTSLPTPDSVTISRIHYRPAALSSAERTAGVQDRDDFEFLEIRNLSDQHILLSGAHFSDGIRYAFSGSLPQLSPQGSLIIAAAPEIFSLRSRSDLPVFGPFRFGSRLANNGERITLVSASGEEIFSVRYNDASPWPKQADGAGFALALRQADTTIDLNDPQSWVAQAQDPTSQDIPSSDLVHSWFEANFTAVDLANPLVSGFDADPDEDKIANLREFFFGTSPWEPSSHENDLQLVDVSAEENRLLSFEFVRRHPIPTGMWQLESSTNLVDWEPIDTEATERELSPTQRAVQLKVSTSADKTFFRLTVSAPN